LFRDRKNFEQFANRQVGLAGDEIQRAMVRAAKAMLGQSVIDGAREPRITEKQKLNAAPHLMLAQKQG
jgi:hypothetical protein